MYEIIEKSEDGELLVGTATNDAVANELLDTLRGLYPDKEYEVRGPK